MRPYDPLLLADGRFLGFAEYGDLQGKPVFFFHGMPGSRLQRHPDDDIAASLGIRLITVDRPGVGLSTFKPARRLVDWPEDVTALADALRLERFAVLGWSGGGPYVAVCAHAMPDRVTAAGFASAFGPMDAPDGLAAMTRRNRLGFQAARSLPWPLVRWLWAKELGAAGQDPAAWYRRWLATLPEADQNVARTYPEAVTLMAQDLAEMLRAGPQGYAWDERLITRPWGFRLEDVRIPTFIWHGDADALAPLSMAETMARRIPAARLTVYQGEGHWLLFKRWREILGTLARAR